MMDEVFGATGKHVPPPPGVQPVFNWGDEDEGARALRRPRRR